MSSLSSAALRPAQPGYDEYPLTPLETPRRRADGNAMPSCLVRRQSERANRMGIRWSLLVCGLLIGGAAAGFATSLHHEFLLGQIAAIVLAAGAMHGLWRGGFRKCVMLAVLAAWTAAAGYLPVVAQSILQRTSGTSSMVVAYLLVGVVGLTAYLLIGKAAKAFRVHVIQPRRWLRAADKSIGLLVGTAEGVVIMLAICWIALTLQPQARDLRLQGTLSSIPMIEPWLEGMEQVAAEAGLDPWGRTVLTSNPLPEWLAGQPWLNGATSGDPASWRRSIGAESPQSASAGVLQSLKNASPEQIQQHLNQHNSAAQARSEQARLLQEKLRVTRGR